MTTVGKYAEQGYEFVYTVKIPSDVMANGTITEERRVFIPDVDFKSAYEIAETIMGNAGRLFSDAARDACQPSLTRLKEISEDDA